MLKLPFCPEHGLRIHKSGFVYYNGPGGEALITAAKRNLMFHAQYCIDNFVRKSNKAESHRLCYESSEDALTFNVFAELLSTGNELKKLLRRICNGSPTDIPQLYLWGQRVDLDTPVSPYNPLCTARRLLREDRLPYPTEPDIMLVVPNKVLICIEAKFGSKNPIAEERKVPQDQKPKSKTELIDKYCYRNSIIRWNDIFTFDRMPVRFHEQLFRNIVFAASIAEVAGIEKWYVVNLRSQHVMNLKKGRAESMPVVRNVRSVLTHAYKNRFVHLTWEELYDICVRDNPHLHNLAWYMKNKTLNCQRAFNIF
ncbi:MAG: hypothetical protein JXN61_03710 [Sedimentisphaerales bacterium]|nr:hypothetical protein [Sedimentisphaerales bacterium]